MGYLSYAQDSNITLKNLDVNNAYPHFAPMLANNNQIIFTSYRLKKNGKVKISFNTEGILAIYKGTISETGDITNIETVQIDRESALESITSAALNADGSRLYIMTTYTHKNMPKEKFNKSNFHLEVGEYKEGVGYTNFKVLPFCKLRYSYAHPSLSLDGKTLYFTANIRGGKQSAKGGSDIFCVDVLDGNTYSEPRNLGYKVNSYGREMFPIMGPNNTLYFSSNKVNGVGGYDIYRSQKQADGTFSKAELLPQPFNSESDDFSLVMLPNGTSGYLVSKREGGNGDDDIYYFRLSSKD